MHKVKLSNKRIIKNTIILYVRMSFIMLVTLYTSRVILNELGVVDFGIYNLIAGFVIMFSFFGSSLSNSAQRFLNVAYGREDVVGANNVFNMAFLNFFIMSIIVVVVLEIFGVWYLNNKLIIPDERMHAANMVFQFSVLSVFVTINSYVYGAILIARERMKIYAYVGILEALGRLIIAIMLAATTQDKLVYYSFLFMTITIMISLIQMGYCFGKFNECRMRLYWNTSLFKKMFVFIGWNAFTALTEAVNQQGINVLLNIFFGPTINAARGISYQVGNALQTFSHNIYTATRPQLVKAYAANNMNYFFRTINMSAKFTYYLLMVLAIPLVLNIDYILGVWLTIVPEYTSIFSVLIIIYSLIDCLKNPLWAAAQAVGDLRRYSLIGGVVFLLNFPLAYMCLMMGFSPYSVYIVYIFIRIAYLWVILRQIQILLPGFNLENYVKTVIIPVSLVTLLTPVLPVVIGQYVDGVTSLIVVSTVTVASSVFVIYFVGLHLEERQYIRKYISKKLVTYAP